MPDRAPGPRKAEIQKVERGVTPEGETVYVYELRGVTPEDGILLSEYEDLADAEDAKHRYENAE
ncbi:hypothetical protein [Larsenimonas salina]|uniref:hypothetical protein n=1 Tax=Larsenimonas salina TaxID=1295565 RepID=UPI002073DA20|nr:hypothetical protein [Larsenimonas salina]MCM5703044.1 hypothetical protein [Larsenimonas salina]